MQGRWSFRPTKTDTRGADRASDEQVLAAELQRTRDPPPHLRLAIILIPYVTVKRGANGATIPTDKDGQYDQHFAAFLPH